MTLTSPSGPSPTRNLSPEARRLIDDPDNQIVVSTVSVWEIAIKHALARGGPNDMPISGAVALGYFRDAGFELLDITPAHVMAIETLGAAACRSV